MSNRDRPRGPGFQSMVCAVDFSPQSSAALQAAVEFVGRNGGHLTALWVENPLLDASAAAAGYSMPLLRKSTLAQLQRVMQRVASPARLSDDAWSVDMVVGQPAPAIAAFARKVDADLIVMGTHGRRGPAAWFFGSVTEAVLRRAPVPVLAVPRGRRRAGQEALTRGILGAIELGSHARGDARRMARVARQIGAPLTLLHVVPMTSVLRLIASQLKRQDDRRLTTARARLAAIAKSVRCSSRVVLGYPDEEIPAVALDAKAGLIVLALRRGRGLFGPRQGTTTYRVLCRSTVPVLALPPHKQR